MDLLHEGNSPLVKFSIRYILDMSLMFLLNSNIPIIIWLTDLWCYASSDMVPNGFLANPELKGKSIFKSSISKHVPFHRWIPPWNLLTSITKVDRRFFLQSSKWNRFFETNRFIDIQFKGNIPLTLSRIGCIDSMYNPTVVSISTKFERAPFYFMRFLKALQSIK